MRSHQQVGRRLTSRAKAQVAGVLCHPTVGRTIASLTRDRVASGRFRVPTNSEIITPFTKAQIFWGSYESAEIRMAEQYLRSDLDLLEVGSSIGVVATHAIARLDACARIACVEANPELIPILRETLKLNHPDRSARVISTAIDYRNAPNTTTLQITEDSSGGILKHLVEQTHAVCVREIETSATTVRVLVEAEEFGPYALIFDIEGAETGFIFADAEELAGCEQILIELHSVEHEGRFYTHDDLAEELARRHGFECLDQHGAVFFFERAR